MNSPPSERQDRTEYGDSRDTGLLSLLSLILRGRIAGYKRQRQNEECRESQEDSEK
jgi:hypothetical protein